MHRCSVITLNSRDGGPIDICKNTTRSTTGTSVCVLDNALKCAPNNVGRAMKKEEKRKERSDLLYSGHVAGKVLRKTLQRSDTQCRIDDTDRRNGCSKWHTSGD